ncbi:hypothetical protein AX16_008116 [Volvariella volvacea WC 439]|nr:hypothetical protein AX16_008116 [Volvariella volvacea WC 439]
MGMNAHVGPLVGQWILWCRHLVKPGVSDPEIEQVINEKVDAFWRALEGGTDKRGQIVIIFLEKKEQQKRSWIPLSFLQDPPEIPWEQWIIDAELRQPKNDAGADAGVADRQKFTSNLMSTLTKSLHTILTHTTSERGRSSVPLITEAGGVSPFPYKVAVKLNGVVVG